MSGSRGLLNRSRRRSSTSKANHRSQAGDIESDSVARTRRLLRSPRKHLTTFASAAARRFSRLSSSNNNNKKKKKIPENREAEAEADAPTVAQQRLFAVLDAQDYLRAFVEEGWPQHAACITVDCGAALDEVRAIGLLPREAGVLACRRLVRAPVINEEIGIALWERLAAEAGRLRQGEQQEPGGGSDANGPGSGGEAERPGKLGGMVASFRERRRTRQRERQRRRELAAGACALCSNHCRAVADGVANNTTVNTPKKAASSSSSRSSPSPSPPPAPLPHRLRPKQLSRKPQNPADDFRQPAEQSPPRAAAQRFHHHDMESATTGSASMPPPPRRSSGVGVGGGGGSGGGDKTESLRQRISDAWSLLAFSLSSSSSSSLSSSSSSRKPSSAGTETSTSTAATTTIALSEGFPCLREGRKSVLCEGRSG